MSDLYILRGTLRDMMRPRKLAAVVGLTLLPALIVLIFRGLGSWTSATALVRYNALASNLVFGFVLVILAVIFGTGVITQEVEQKTIVYLLTRPVPRWRILLMKFAATAILTTASVWIALLLLALVTGGLSGLSSLPLARDLALLLVGALAYSGLFLMMATLLERPLIFGLLFAFGWESWVPQLPGNFKMLSLMGYLRTLAPHVNPGDDQTSAMGPLMMALSTQTIPDPVAWSALIGVIVFTLIGALVIFSTREFVPREEAA